MRDDFSSEELMHLSSFLLGGVQAGKKPRIEDAKKARINRMQNEMEDKILRIRY